MTLQEKLEILSDSAKYDVACTSSGSQRSGKAGHLGNTLPAGLCHSFSGDGRCITLLKVLLTNHCIYDCAYCQNRRSNDLPRTMFTPQELAELTIGFYRRNYIEGLFLSSGVFRSPDDTTLRMIETLRLLRTTYRFNGYIHAKTIPGSSPELIAELGLLADRLSVNLELPSENSLKLLAPDKPRTSIFRPMGQIHQGIRENQRDLVRYQNAPTFSSAGQSTQMIIGASPDTDFQIIRLAQGLYHKYELKRVFYSAYIPVGTSQLLPQNQPPPLLREHRLYQADWLLRFYGFAAEEILSEQHPTLDPQLDPKCNWALHHIEYFPVEINTADRHELLRVPGIGPVSADKIIKARRQTKLTFEDLRKLRIVLRRAVYFITCRGKQYPGVTLAPDYIYHNLLADDARRTQPLPGAAMGEPPEQLSLFAPSTPALISQGVRF